MATSKPVVKTVAKRELSTNNYIAAVVAVSLIVVIVCGLIGKSMVNSLIINTKLITGKAQAKSNLDTKLANIPTLLNNYNNLGTSKQLIADGLPTTSDFPQIVSIIPSIGSASGVDVKSIDPALDDGAVAGDVNGSSTSTSTINGSAVTTAPSSTQSASSTTPTPYVFTTTVAGPYQQIVQFFKDMELSDRPMHVTATQITSSSGVLTVQATVQTFYQGAANINDTTEPVK